jgi:hypothetical protein
MLLIRTLTGQDIRSFGSEFFFCGSSDSAKSQMYRKEENVAKRLKGNFAFEHDGGDKDSLFHLGD